MALCAAYRQQILKRKTILSPVKLEETAVDQNVEKDEPKTAAPNARKLILNNYNTNYPVVEEAALNVGLRVVCRDHNLRPS